MSEIVLTVQDEQEIELTAEERAIIEAISPSATVEKVGDTATITITDKDGTTTATISDGTDGRDGTDGTDGQDGFSPTATVTKSGATATITITDKDGTTTATVTDGTGAMSGVVMNGETVPLDAEGVANLGTVITDKSDKADKVSGGTTDNFAALDASGNLKDSGHKHSDYLTSHQDISGKADKVTGEVSGNFAGLDGNGNLTDSGHKHSDYLTSHQDISGKADKVSGATSGNFAGLDANGNLTDSGKKASDFPTSTWREVQLAVGVSDWTLSSGVYTAEFSSAYITATCKFEVELDVSWRTYAKNDITTELKSGGGAILLHTETIPTGTITGTVSVLDADDGRTMTVVQDTVTTIAHGGTGASTVAGAKVNLEIPTVVDVLNSSSTADALSANKGKALNDSITTLNTHITPSSTGTITKASKATDGTMDYTTCTKKGDFVFVSGRIYNLPGTTTAIGTFFNIPSGFRPSETVFVNGYMSVTGVGSIPVLAEITTAGAVNLGYSASNYVTQVGFSGFYKQ